MADQQKPAGGDLIVALTADGKNVVINHPDLQPDADGCGHIVFSPAQARNLAWMLFLRANIVEGLICGNCNNPITQEGGWATALVRYCFKEECQQEFYKEAQAMIRAVDPETADLLAAATRGNAFTTVDVLNEVPTPDEAYINSIFFTCPKCRKVSHNPDDVREKYCGACHLFFGETKEGMPL